MEKDERIKKEIQKLRKIFKNLPKDKSAIVEKLISNAAFMAVTLDDLQDAVNKNGCVIDYGTKRNPAAEIYNTMIKNYSTTIKQLIDLLPTEEAKVAESEFVKFIQKQRAVK